MLQKYQKADNRYYDEADHDSHTLEESKRAREFALRSLEDEINIYIDNRIREWHIKYND